MSGRVFSIQSGGGMEGSAIQDLGEAGFCNDEYSSSSVSWFGPCNKHTGRRQFYTLHDAVAPWYIQSIA